MHVPGLGDFLPSELAPLDDPLPLGKTEAMTADGRTKKLLKASETVISRAELDRRPNFGILSLGRIEVDLADFRTSRLLSSNSRRRAQALVSKSLNPRTLKM